jgi:hypothetical protein
VTETVSDTPIVTCECGYELEVLSCKEGKIVTKQCVRCAVDYYNQGIRYEIKSEELLSRLRNAVRPK